MISPSTKRALEYAERAGWSRPYLGVRIPDPVRPRGDALEVEVLYTTGEAPPNWSNLALMIQGTAAHTAAWQARVERIPARGMLLTRPDDCLWFSERGRNPEQISWANVGRVLEDHREDVFSPQSLARYHRGQLTLADLEDRPGPLSYALRVRAQMEEVARQAFRAVLDVESKRNTGASRRTVGQLVLAYIGARVFQDKGVAGIGVNPNDPEAVVRSAVSAGNGFLRNSLRLMHTLQLESLQAMGAFLGVRVSFALADHTDIGRLYESLQDELDVGAPDLERHYTPLALAERMLAALPVERVRPERRLVYDPAAGSGTLLMAATLRLKGLGDSVVPLCDAVAGNDADPFAAMITHLRYQLMQATEGGKNERWSPTSFTQHDLREVTHAELPFVPGVLVANPPYSEEGGVQIASAFVERFTRLMPSGCQFALVLPDSFWQGRGQGTGVARDALLRRSRLFESWDVPEGVVGLQAKQAVAVVIGELTDELAGTPRVYISRSVTSRRKDVVNAARRRGFVGAGQLCAAGEAGGAAISRDGTVKLSVLCEVKSGVQPRPAVAFLDTPPENGPEWRAWLPSPSHRPADGWYQVPANARVRRWVDPSSVGASAERVELLLREKVVTRRVANRDSRSPLAPLIDAEGCLPDSNYYALVFRSNALPNSWERCSVPLRLGALTAILGSQVVQQLLHGSRPARYLPKAALADLPLPARLTTRFVALVADALAMNRADKPISELLSSEIEEQVVLMLGFEAAPSVPSIAAQLQEFARSGPVREAVGQVLDLDVRKQRIRLYLSGFDVEDEVVPVPAELPGWALEGVPFDVQLPVECRTVGEAAAGWSLTGFRHTPRPYLTEQEVEAEWGTST